MAIEYTPGQLRHATAISQETYRHWKNTLAPLRRGMGRSRYFTAGDILAVAIIRCLTTDFAIRVSAVAATAPALFHTCNATPWPKLERGKLIVDLANDNLQFLQEPEAIDCQMPALVVPLRPMAEHLRGMLFAEDRLANQKTLRLPPTPLASKSGARR